MAPFFSPCVRHLQHIFFPVHNLRMLGEGYQNCRAVQMTPSSASFLYPAQRVPSSLGIEPNTGFVSWKELKSALFYCTSWHSMNDLKGLSWKGSLATGGPVVPQQSRITQEHCTLRDRLRQGGSSWPARKKLIIRTTGRYMRTFMVFMAPFAMLS